MWSCHWEPPISARKNQLPQGLGQKPQSYKLKESPTHTLCPIMVQTFHDQLGSLCSVQHRDQHVPGTQHLLRTYPMPGPVLGTKTSSPCSFSVHSSWRGQLMPLQSMFWVQESKNTQTKMQGSQGRQKQRLATAAASVNWAFLGAKHRAGPSLDNTVSPLHNG